MNINEYLTEDNLYTILTFLEKDDLHSVRQVCQGWKSIAFQPLKEKEKELFDLFFQYITINLHSLNLSNNDYTSQKIELLKLQTETTFKNETNITSLNKNINHTITSIANILKMVEFIDLRNLDQMQLPKAIKTIFLLTKVKIFNDREKFSFAVANIAKIFAENGQYEKAIEIAKDISNFFDKGMALSAISMALIDNGRAGKVVEVASHFDANNDISLLAVIDKLKLDGYIKIARKIKKNIDETRSKSLIISRPSKKIKCEEKK